MRKLFGTDGIRARANSEIMNAEVVMKIGAILGRKFKSLSSTNKILIGKDTRRSGYMIENAITAGLVSSGKDVFLCGPVPTPAVSFLTKSLRCDLGIMISASHNPYFDNGIKFFGPSGEKLLNDIQSEIEHEFFNSKFSQHLCDSTTIGMVTRVEDVAGRYVEFVKAVFPQNANLHNFRIVVDCANGSNYKIAPEIFWELGANVIAIGNNPNGKNINENCGSTHPELLREKVLESRADIGIALDGDGDRLTIVDECGNVVDGDQVLAALIVGSKGELKNNKSVTTIMSNSSLDRYLLDNGIENFRSGVGDKEVYGMMKKVDSYIGGEESGHIILRNYGVTGDGILAGLKILSFMQQSDKRASEILSCFNPIPQYLDNIYFENKPKSDISQKIIEIKEEAEKMIKNARVIIRQSGTENVIRIMVETEDREKEVMSFVKEKVLNLIYLEC